LRGQPSVSGRRKSGARHIRIFPQSLAIGLVPAYESDKCARLNTFKNKREQILGEKIKLIADTSFPVSSEWESRLTQSQRHFIGLAPE
jgi:hypothetical protein